MVARFCFKGENVQYSENYITSNYNYNTNSIVTSTDESGNTVYHVEPVAKKFVIKTSRVIPKTGVMLVGWGGNNGTTLTGVIIANKLGLKWNTKTGEQCANYYGSIVKSSTLCLGTVQKDDQMKKVCAPMFDLLPFVDPNNLEIDGWDINSMDIADSMERAQVFDYNLQVQLRNHMIQMKPRPSVYNPSYIASNQAERSDNLIQGTLAQQMNQIRADIRDFKIKKNLDKVIIMWTASTECYTQLNTNSHSSAEALLKAIEDDRKEDISPSTLFAVSSILEGCIFINGSPQNSLYPAVQELALKHRVFIAGDDFKTGQTKLKSSLVEFLIGSGIKPVCIASYNHLGNNDGLNLNSYAQFRSKEISKSTVIDEMVESNRILYGPNEKPDHCIVIKYLPFVGDSKRAMDEYTSKICMNGIHTLVIHNTCEDSLLAAPVMLDLILLSELFSRIMFKKEEQSDDSYTTFNSILSAVSFLLKAPLVSNKEPLINGLGSQKACIENLIRACLGIPPENHMYLEEKLGN